MIKLIYEHICDVCRATLDTEEYFLGNDPRWEYPRPHRQFSFDLTTLHAQLCGECAQPMYDAVEEMKKKAMEHIQTREQA